MYTSLLVVELLFISSVLSIPASQSGNSLRSDGDGGCQPFHTTFPSSAISGTNASSFLAVSSPSSYHADGTGLQLFLDEPPGEVKSHNGVNNKVAEGATINSTFTLSHGTVTFRVSAPAIPGVVTAAILLSDQGDEIDIELLGGYPSTWQTNVFAPTPQDPGPNYGQLSSIENVPGSDTSMHGSIEIPHAYSVDWNANRIIWSVDDHPVRTLTRGQTFKKGIPHYPTHPMRIQLGIWDASSPKGTSEWAKGPINWTQHKDRIRASVHSLTVECH